jgi:hypothetical protein
MSKRVYTAASYENYSTSCTPNNTIPAEALISKSEYTWHFAVGYAEHKYSDGSGSPACMMIAQYEEFSIQFTATISDNGLAYQEFNDLVEIIDQAMIQKLGDE